MFSLHICVFIALSKSDFNYVILSIAYPVCSINICRINPNKNKDRDIGVQYKSLYIFMERNAKQFSDQWSHNFLGQCFPVVKWAYLY